MDYGRAQILPSIGTIGASGLSLEYHWRSANDQHSQTESRFRICEGRNVMIVFSVPAMGSAVPGEGDFPRAGGDLVWSEADERSAKKYLCSNEESLALIFRSLLSMGQEGELLAARLSGTMGLLISSDQILHRKAEDAPPASSDARARLFRMTAGSALEGMSSEELGSILPEKTEERPAPKKGGEFEIFLAILSFKDFVSAGLGMESRKSDRESFRDFGLERYMSAKGPSKKMLRQDLLSLLSAFFSLKTSMILALSGDDLSREWYGEFEDSFFLPRKKETSDERILRIVSEIKSRAGKLAVSYPEPYLSEDVSAEFSPYLCVLRIPYQSFSSSKLDLLAMGADKFSLRIRPGEGFKKWETSVLRNAREEGFVIKVPVLVESKNVQTEDIIKAFVSLGIIKGFVSWRPVGMNQTGIIPDKNEIFYSELSFTQKSGFYVCRRSFEPIKFSRPIAVTVSNLTEIKG